MSDNKLGQFPSTRLRRLRMKEFSRRMVSENNLSVNDLIWPLFVCEGNNITDKINSMPGVFRYSIDNILKELIYTQDGKMIIDPRYTDFAKMSKIYIVKKYGNIQDFLKFAKEEINNTYNTQNFNKLYDVLKELFILSFAK